MRKRPLFLSALVFGAGLLCYRYQRYEMVVWLIIWLGYEIYCSRENKKKIQVAGRCILLLATFLLGNLHMSSELAFRENYLSKMQDGSTITVWGEVIKREFRDTGEWNSIYLSDCYISLEGAIIPCNDVIIYSSNHRYEIGEIHKISGELNMFEKAANEGGFDRKQYYQSLKIDFAVYEKEHLCLKRSDNWLKCAILKLGERIAHVYESCATLKLAGFLTGMILGDRSGLDKALKDLFTDGGLAHILAISGLHVSIIGRGFYGLLRKRGMSFGLAGILGSVLLVSYCFLVGNGMSAIRAVGMMFLYFSAQALGRSYDMLNSLGVMAFVLLWQNPFLLNYSGFLFSVTALLGVGYVASIWGKFGSGVAITMTSLPLVALSYYEIPLYAPLTNFLLLPLLTPIFTLALLAGVVGIWIPWLAECLLLPCEWGLGIYEWVCTAVSKLPLALVITGKPEVWAIVLYYGALLVGTYVIKKKYYIQMDRGEKKLTWTGKIRGIGIFALCLWLVIYPKPQQAEISFLDVGQGDGIYINSGDGSSFFLDGGSAFSDSLGEYTLLPFLKSKDVSGIDYWFVSHADNDHISGLKEVFQSGYMVRHLVVSAYAPQQDKLRELLELAEGVGTQIIYMKAGDYLETDNCCIRCIYPGETDVAENPELAEDCNEMAMVLEVSFAELAGIRNFTALFTGDISSKVEKRLVEEGRVGDVDLYKAAHHGSRYSNSKEFLECIRPEWIVVSCSATNTYGHPGPEAVKRMEEIGAQIRYTMEEGQIQFK